MRTPLALIALTLSLLFSSAQAVRADDVFTSGYTDGCFDCASPPDSSATQTDTLAGLTYTNSQFSGTTANGFRAFGDGPSPSGVQGTNNFGSLTLAATVNDYTSRTFKLRVTFTAPEGIAGGGSRLITAMLTGAVSGQKVGGVFVDFDNTPQTFTFNDTNCQATTVSGQQTTCGSGTFTFVVNDVAIDSGTTVSLSGSVTAATQAAPPPPPPLIISEFRFSGTNTQDEFVELYNNTDSSVTVATADGSTGWSLVSNDSGVLTVRATITNGTVIPARAHYLLASSPFIGGYQLTGYAVPDKPIIPADISNGAGIALFRTSNTANFTIANRLDAVGFSGVANSLYREGTGLAPSGGIAPTTSNYSFVRDLSTGKPKDTDNNTSDFRLVSNDGAVLGGVQSTLGAPGPESLASPVDRTSKFATLLLDSTQASSSPPNRDRDFTPDPANNASQGTMTIRRRFVNMTGASVTRMRFRIIIITGSPVPDGATADLRSRTSSDSTVNNVNDPATCSPGGTPCSVTVSGTALEPPSAANNGGLNSSLLLSGVTSAPQEEEFVPTDRRAAPTGATVQVDPLPVVEGDGDNGTINLNAPLANGASINVQFVLGVQQPGKFRFYVIIEALP